MLLQTEPVVGDQDFMPGGDPVTGLAGGIAGPTCAGPGLRRRLGDHLACLAMGRREQESGAHCCFHCGPAPRLMTLNDLAGAIGTPLDIRRSYS
jgi:hypothetical protein